MNVTGEIIMDGADTGGEHPPSHRGHRSSYAVVRARAPIREISMVEPERRSKWITHLWPIKVGHSERIQALQEAGGSLPFYDRYVAGEFREVWMELAALGDA